MGGRSPVVEKLVSIPPFWRLVFSLIVAGMLLGVWLFAFVHNVLVSGQDLPVALHSPLEADYSADAVAFIPASRMNLLREAISDRARDKNDLTGDQIATVVDQMRTPVFTVTPYPGMTVQPGALPTRVRATETSSMPEQTPVVPTMTINAPTITISATAQTPTATATATQGFAFTVTPGFYFPTSLPTATVEPTRTPNPTQPPVFASPTQAPATQTPVPQQPTNTLAPPTHTPQPPTSVPPTDTQVPYPPPGTSYP